MKLCEKCKAPFVSRLRKSRTCSLECRTVLYREEHREDAKHRARKWYASNTLRAKEWQQKNNRRGIISGVCRECEAEFWYRSGRQYFCSGKCRRVNYRRNSPHVFARIAERGREKTKIRLRKGHYRTRATTPWKILLRAAKSRAKKYGVPFVLTYEWAEQNWTGRCRVTNLPFVLTARRRVAMSPSIDQIVAGRGYTPENSRFVLWAINAAKGSDTDATFRAIACAVVENGTVPDAGLMLSLPG